MTPLELWRVRRKSAAVPEPQLEGDPQPCTEPDCDGGWVDTTPCGICGGYGIIDPAKEVINRLGGSKKTEPF